MPRQILAAIIPRCPQLRWVQSTWAGIDAIAHFASETLQITPLKGVFGPAMTEYVMGWLLAIERNVISRASHTHWAPSLEPRIAGKRLGIMGTGGIGIAIALAAKHFGLEVIGLNSDGRAVDGFTACYPECRSTGLCRRARLSGQRAAANVADG